MSKGLSAELEDRYGPYQVIKSLVRAPGAWLVEARDEDVRCILQLARCKPATDPEAKADRQDFVEMIAAATQHLASDPDVEILAHGATEETDGSLMLYWAMPWVDGTEAVGQSPIDTPDRLAFVGVALLAQVEARHDRGRLTPTLSDQVLIIRDDHAPAQLGLPLHLPPGWLTSDVPAPRFAPEERDRSEPRQSGDLWRVGRTLRALGAHLTDWPQEFIKLVDRLDAERVGDRFSDARTAREEIETMLAVAGAATESGAAPRLAEPQADDSSGNYPVVSTPSAAADDGSMPDEPAPDLSLGVRRLADAPPISNKEGATVRVQLSASDRRKLFGAEDSEPVMPSDPSPDGAFAETIVDQPRPDLSLLRQATQPPQSRDETTLQDIRREPAEPGRDATAVRPRGKDAPTRRTVWDKADAAAPPPTKPTGPKGTVVGVRLINEPTGLRPGKEPNVPVLLPPPEIKEAQDPALMQRSPPGGAPALPGPHPQPALPGPAPMSAMGAAPLGYPAPVAPAMNPMRPTGDVGMRPGPGTGTGSGEVYVKRVAQETPISVATAGPTPSKALPNVLVALVFFLAGIAATVAGQVFMAAPESPAPNNTAAATTLQTIHPAGEVLLQASPDTAVVVSERDGQVLGKTPLRFLVPPERDYSVLVTAKGHEPVRLVLPQRGRLRTDLVPLDGRTCRVLVKSPDDERLVGVDVEVPFDDLYGITGAAVLRSPKGRGAWMVRCPALGGTTKVTLAARPRAIQHHLSVLAPAGAEVTLDGVAKGKVPFRGPLPARFIRVKAETLSAGASERWIPFFAPTQLKMPRPPANSK